MALTLDALQAENRRLQRELRHAQEQRVIQKTFGILSAPSGSDDTNSFPFVQAAQQRRLTTLW